MKYRSLTVVLVLLIITFALIAPDQNTVGAGSTDSSIIVTLERPTDKSTIANQTPLIVISYYSPNGIDDDTINGSISLVVDDLDVTSLELFTFITSHNVTYQVINRFKLSDGQHNVTISLSDNTGNYVKKTFSFTVNTTQSQDESSVASGPTLHEIAIWALMAIGIGAVGFGTVIIYLKKTRNFTFRKFFAKHPIPKSIFIMVIPGVAAALFILFAFAFVLSDPNITTFALEYVIVISFFIGLLPYAVYAQTEKKTIAKYERAFSQFLFEMADAMRGGIDPSKAIIELSKTDTSILGKHLKIAARGIEMGRPFEEMIMVMIKPINSKLIRRYASLVGESAKVGGEISLVVHRAAKDMDDLIKIDAERAQSLTTQATTIYISFGVMLILIYQLMSLYPSLGHIDFGSILGGGGGLDSAGSSTASTSSRMSLDTMKHRFFDLVLVLSMGNGILIGLFTNGKMKYGLLHSLIMILATTFFFMLLVL